MDSSLPAADFRQLRAGLRASCRERDWRVSEVGDRFGPPSLRIGQVLAYSTDASPGAWVYFDFDPASAEWPDTDYLLRDVRLPAKRFDRELAFTPHGRSLRERVRGRGRGKLDVIVQPSVKTGITVMDIAAFWRLIENINLEALCDGDEDGAVEPLIEALAKCSEDDIREFEDQLAQCLYDIDGRIYADHAEEAGHSGDGFLYLRCFVVARGRKFYEKVKADPKKIPKALDESCEPLIFVSPRAWAAATGKDEEEWDHDSPVSYETGNHK